MGHDRTGPGGGRERGPARVPSWREQALAPLFMVTRSAEASAGLSVEEEQLRGYRDDYHAVRDRDKPVPAAVPAANDEGASGQSDVTETPDPATGGSPPRSATAWSRALPGYRSATIPW